MDALTDFSAKEIECLLGIALVDARRANAQTVDIIEDVMAMQPSVSTELFTLYKTRKEIADTLMLWEVQLRNALAIVRERERTLNT